MRQDKTIARIVLIFSVANIVLATPAAVRRRHMNVAETASRSGKRGGSEDETTDGSGQMPELVSDSDESRLLTNSESDPYFSALESPLGSSPQDSPAHSPVSFHEGSEPSGDLALWPFDSTHHDFALTSSFGSSHQDVAPEPPDGSSHHDSATESPTFEHWLIPSTGGSVAAQHDAAPEPPQSNLLHPDLAPPESTVFNDALKKKLKILGALGVAAGISGGVIYAVQKKIKDSHSPDA